MGRLKDEAIYREDNPKGLAEAEAAYECETCSFVEAEYARANDSDLTRDALALQNAALKADLESLRTAISNLRVLRSSCADSHDGDFRVHLCEREFDALTIMAKAGRVQ